ncbi:hypothetical protein BS47DRAFT_1347010 [Hydnum rufescens UP504]|uniref:Uncharacterized protein n=1 Tax=Hydnum rufescens UP504 TaxID=1448309 RepID=A0A9P6ASK1_9AGAM|nr:hypothetical protein BS47DRAFT_1347010 [Hydnum rufescens UP504]
MTLEPLYAAPVPLHFSAHAFLVYHPSELPCCYGNRLHEKSDEATHFFLFEELKGFLDMAKPTPDVDLLQETDKLGPPVTVLDPFLTPGNGTRRRKCSSETLVARLPWTHRSTGTAFLPGHAVALEDAEFECYCAGFSFIQARLGSSLASLCVGESAQLIGEGSDHDSSRQV